MSAASPYLHVLRPYRAGKPRLYCIPHSARGASLFRPWVDSLAAQRDVAGIQLPGREARLREEPFATLPPLVSDVADAITQDLAGAEPPRFALFGASMGAVLAFEVARELAQRAAPAPEALFVVGVAPPALDVNVRLALRAVERSDQELVDDVLALGGTPRSIFENVELKAIVLKLLRADLRALAVYRYEPRAPLTCPIHVFCGTEDAQVRAAGVEAWSAETTGAVTLDLFPGGHLFLTHQMNEAGEKLLSRLG